MFEAKAKLSEICEEVASSGEPIVVTRRGKPLVRILPLQGQPMSIRKRRERYLEQYGRQEKKDKVDFEPATRSREYGDFDLQE